MIATYDGSPFEGCIEAETDPWIEVDGVPVDWSARAGLEVWSECPCGEGGPVPLPSVLAPMNTDVGVQRCDACCAFDGDLDAALALARLVGGVVRFHLEDAS